MRAPMHRGGPAPDEALTAFLTRYDGLRARLPGSATARDAAATVLREHGWPTTRDEAWHYTNIRPLAGLEFHEAVADTELGERLIGLLPDVAGPRLIFVDGRFSPDLSVLPPDITVGAFSGDGAFGTLARPARDRLVALNTMLAEDGAVIDVPAGVDGGFLMLAQLTSGRHRRVGSHPRHRVRLGAGAKLVLLEVSAGEGEYLNNPVIEIEVGEAAHLTHGRLQQDSQQAFHLGTVYVDIAATGVYDGFSLALGGRLGRTEIHARLGGPEAAVHLNAAQIMGGTQLSDFTTAIAHDAPNCALAPDGEVGVDRESPRCVPGADRGRAHRPEDRRLSDEPDAAAFARRRDQQQARARDLRRRREVQPWCHGRRARPRAVVLSPQSRHSRRRRPHDAGARFPDRRLRGGQS